MKARIETLLDKLQLSPSKFADELGIQRSGMSHILSGRNNPSLDLIQKILSRFPEINIDWLVQGQGPILVTERIVELSKKDFSSNTPPTLSQKEKIFPQEQHILSDAPVTKLEPRPQLALFDMSPSKPIFSVEEKNTILNKKSETNASFKETTAMKTNLEKEKRIKRIVIFYADNTFSAHSPEE